MGKKYIITESQEKLIYSLVERELGPEESILIAKKNPWNYEEFKDARKEYNPSLKEGERFYIFDVGSFKGKIFSEVDKKIDGKTTRMNDKIVTIKVVKFINDSLWEQENNPIIDSLKKDDTRFLNLIVGNYNLWFDINGNLRKMFFEGITSSSPRREVPDIVRTSFEKLYAPFLDNIKKVIEDEVNNFKFDDNYFEIREIKRKQTDF